MSIGPPILEIQLFQNLTLKIQGQCHCQGQTQWLHRIQSICSLLISWQSDHFWLRYSTFHIWPWKFKVKVMAKVNSDHADGHTQGLKFHPYVCFSFRGYRTIFGWFIANSIFDHWKFKVKVIAKVKSDGYIWGLESNWYVCFLFHGNWAVFWLRKSKFDFENSRSRSRWKSAKI